MKKIIICIIAIALLSSMLPTGSVSAASLPTCSIATWQVTYNGASVSGGCTCHVAERVRTATGKLVPNWHNAGSWWSNSTWPKSTNEPRVGAIAGFSYGHVAYVESMTLKSKSSPIKMQTTQYTLNWVKYSATLYKITETYTVRLSQKDFARIVLGDNSVRYTTIESKLDKYSWTIVNLHELDSVRDRSIPTKPSNTWTTPRSGNASSLQGFIYP